jgi:hypothetical protein
MGDMHGSTFTTSRTERERRRADGPVLTLLRGGAVRAPAHPRVVPHAHPAIEGFTPDGDPGDSVRTAVHSSGPESPSGHRSSRGSATPDVGGTAHSGPGPNVSQADMVRRIADRLAAFDARAGAPGAVVVHLR